jgi:hypothetical protein
MQNYSFVHCNCYGFRQQTGRHTVLYWMASSINRFQSPFNFLVNQLLIFHSRTQIYCDLFDWRPSLLGNRKLNTPMHTRDSSTVGSDMLTTPVLLVIIATNSRKASVCRIATNSKKASVGRLATNSGEARFSIGPSKCYIEEARESTSQSLSTPVAWVSLRQSASEISLGWLVFGIRVSWLVSGSRKLQCSQWVIEAASASVKVFSVIVICCLSE